MSLDVVRVRGAAAPSLDISPGRIEPAVFQPWVDWEPSPISHHGLACCEVAREWVVATDFSGLNGANMMTGPRWLRQRFEWGPSIYPIHWCELVKKPKLDCGVLAALSYEVFVSRGVACFRAQLVQEFCDSSARAWRSSWENSDAITAWIRDSKIYHEGVAVQTRENEVKLWDSSAGWWIDPKTTSGYGSLLALRVTSQEEKELVWGNHRVWTNAWTEVR